MWKTGAKSLLSYYIYCDYSTKVAFDFYETFPLTIGALYVQQGLTIHYFLGPEKRNAAHCPKSNMIEEKPSQ